MNYFTDLDRVVPPFIDFVIRPLIGSNERSYKILS